MRRFLTHITLLFCLFFAEKGISQNLQYLEKDSIKVSDETILKLGGALSFNYNLSTWKPEVVKRGGDFGFVVFGSKIYGKHKGITLNLDYRIYAKLYGGGMLREGWFGYNFNDDKTQLQVGLNQVPFGNQKYNSSCWFFNLTYYLGFEDDHDMGVKLIQKTDRFDYHLAFYKNSEELIFGNDAAISPDRFAYDIAGRNKEVNQGNFKVDYKFDKERKSNLSAFGQYGGLYNVITRKFGNHYAYGIAFSHTWKRFNFKGEAFAVSINPNDSITDRVAMGAYGSTYDMATQGNVYTVGINYTIPMEIGPISAISIYNDFGMYDKTEVSFSDSYMNVLGASVNAGKLFIYHDFAFGRNHSWLGPNYINAFAPGDFNGKWNLRYNINIGYYF